MSLGVSVLNAETFELRGSGILPDTGQSAIGVPGEEITVSVMLSSDDFQYIPLSNPIIHYFAPSAAIPVNIHGAVSGDYAGVSPIARFVALELENSTSAGDMLMLDVAAGTAGTSLLSLSTSGVSGFDGSVTPQNSNDLFSLFADAMDDQGVWTPSSSSAVFVGAQAELLFLGQLQWTLINPLAGDFDVDGDVDGRDFLLWQRSPAVAPLSDWQTNYGMVATDPYNQTDSGNFNEDGQVDGRDFLFWQRDTNVGNLTAWQAQYGTSQLAANSLTIPEPGAMALVSLCACAAISLRHSASKRG